MNQELPDVQARFRKGRGTIDQIPNICWIIEKARELQKNIYFCFIDYTNAFDFSMDHNKLRKILQEMGIPDHLTCHLRNLYAGSGSNSTWNRLVPNWERSTWRIYIRLYNIYKLSPWLFICRVHHANMQSTSCEMLGWMKHKLESRLLGEISITSDMQMILPLWQKVKKN